MRRKKLALVTLVVTLGGAGLTAPPALATVEGPPTTPSDPGPGNSSALEHVRNPRAVQALIAAIARQNS